MDVMLIATVMLTVVVMIFIGLLVVLFSVLINKIKRKTNPIDFLIIETGKDAVTGVRHEIGRMKQDKLAGNIYVTAKGLLGNKIKDNLGPSITDQFMHPSAMGFRRKYCIGMFKDGVFAPVKIDNIPESLSMTPVTYEAVNFMLSCYRDNIEINKPSTNPMIPFIWAGLGLVGLAIIGVIVIIVIGVTQAPTAVEGIRAAAAVAPLPPG